MIVQRTLSAKNLVHAKGGVLLAGALKFLPLYLLVLPGMAARVLYTDSVACSDPEACKSICGAPTGCSNLAYIELVLNLLPVGTSNRLNLLPVGKSNRLNLLPVGPTGSTCCQSIRPAGALGTAPATYPFFSYCRQCTYGGK